MTYCRLIIVIIVVMSLLLGVQKKEVMAIVQSDRTLYYERYNLLGVVDFQYEKETRRQNKSGKETEHSQFTQNYFLGLRGNYLSTRFFIFDADVEFEKTNSSSSSSQRDKDTKVQRYNFVGTFFPNYYFPLTLTLRRKVRERSGNETIGHFYGLDWEIDHWRYPETRLRLGYTTSDSKSSNAKTLNYRATFKKKILEAHNRLSFSGVRGEVNTAAGKTAKHDYNNFAYNYLVRHRFLDTKTKVNLRKTSSSFESNDVSNKRDRANLGISVNQRLHPKVSQSFGYGFGFSETDKSESVNNRFSYGLGYRPSKRLHVKQTFRYRIKDKESEDIEEGEEYWRSDSYVRYNHFTGLRFNGSLYYFKKRTDFEDVLTGAETDKGYGIKGGLGYAKGIKIWRFTLSAAYTIGYKRIVRVFPDGEKQSRETFPQTLTLSANFDFDKGVGKGLILKYVRLQGDYKLDVGLSSIGRFEDEQDDRRFRLDPDVSIESDSGIDERFEEDDFDNEGTWSHLFTLRMDKYGNYWRRTKFKSKLTYRIKKGRRGAGTEHRTNVAGSINHKRIIRIRKLMRGRLSGQLTLNARLNLRKTESDYHDTENIRVRYNAQYKFSPFRSSRMTLAFERDETYTKSSEIFTDTYEALIEYRLRAWRFEIELEREIVEDSLFSDYTNDRIFLRATREFTRVF